MLLENLVIEKSDKIYYHPGQSGDVFLGNKKGPKVGSFGTIHPLILKKMDIQKSNIIGLEIYLDNFIEPKKLSRVSKKQLNQFLILHHLSWRLPFIFTWEK